MRSKFKRDPYDGTGDGRHYDIVPLLWFSVRFLSGWPYFWGSWQKNILQNQHFRMCTLCSLCNRMWNRKCLLVLPVTRYFDYNVFVITNIKLNDQREVTSLSFSLTLSLFFSVWAWTRTKLNLVMILGQSFAYSVEPDRDQEVCITHQNHKSQTKK